MYNKKQLLYSVFIFLFIFYKSLVINLKNCTIKTILSFKRINNLPCEKDMLNNMDIMIAHLGFKISK